MNPDTLDTDFEPIYLNEEDEQDSCLVLCIEERDNPDDYDSIDTRVFVSYSETSDVYVVNGKRVDLFSRRGRNKTNFQPFMFCANSSSPNSQY